MHVKNFVICDTEQQYARNLLQMLNRKKKTSFQFYLFHSPKEAEKFAKQKPVHTLLISGECSADQRRKIEAAFRYVLVKDEKEPLQPDEKGVYRYQSAEAVWNLIVNESEESPRSHITGELIGIYSPVHRIGKTKFALSMGRKLAQKMPVLYLNLEEYAGEEFYFQGKSELPPKHLGDLIYDFRQERKNLGIRISMMAGQLGNMDYIRPMPYVQDFREVTGEEWQALIGRIREQCIYEKIILDLGDSVNGLFQILEQCNVIYTPYIEEPPALEKLNRYTENLRRCGMESILEKTIQKKMKPKESGKRSRVTEKNG